MKIDWLKAMLAFAGFIFISFGINVLTAIGIMCFFMTIDATVERLK